MFLEPIIILFLLRDLRRILRTTSPLPEWDRNLKLAMYAVAALLVLEILLPIKGVTIWVWHLVIFAILGMIYLNPVLIAARTVMLAVLPFAVLSLFVNISKLLMGDRYGAIDSYLDAAIVFSIIWLVAMFIISRKQQKALGKERQKTLQEEEQKMLMAKRKEELESIVAERTSELTQQKEELEKALVDLKSAQGQLIQSEKMASLGELTAGIAHEIQNPLNFINNFSEVNTELIEEMQQELNAGNKEHAIALANDIKENEHKINHHGKRADAIVKSMLQHSRSRAGQIEPTDINALADEYLRLAYHGLRAKDKSFNATLITDYDKNIGNINIIPQDIGRVILNLITNAFYAVIEKKNGHHMPKGAVEYEPTVSVSTRLIQPSPRGSRKVEIKVKDNGNGIPQKVLDKIFQPFFSTKPTGQGTGLGLSLSYEIITKGHGGELKVATKEGEFAEFIIQLPLV